MNEFSFCVQEMLLNKSEILYLVQSKSLDCCLFSTIAHENTRAGLVTWYKVKPRDDLVMMFVCSSA